MKCYKHNDKDIVVQCHGCGKGLCPECSQRFNKILCEDCITSTNANYKGQIIKQFVLMIVIFIFVFMEFINKPDTSFIEAIFAAYVFSCAPWGWSILNRITPQVFLILPIFGWVLYFFYKLIISIMIGFVVAPYKIFKNIKDWKTVDQTQKNIVG